MQFPLLDEETRSPLLDATATIAFENEVINVAVPGKWPPLLKIYCNRPSCICKHGLVR